MAKKKRNRIAPTDFPFGALAPPRSGKGKKKPKKGGKKPKGGGS